MTKKIVFIFLILSVALPLTAQNRGKADLQEKYRKWLEEEVAYIITPKEKNVFLKLTTDRERDLFIEAFWKHRDPSPGTPRNEFKDEHYRRVEYANKFFGRGTPRPGWKTDMGRTYIVLGPPNTIEYFENVMNVYPTQVWAYLGDPKVGLPPAFNIVFFKKYGTGEYVFYSPSDHGPQSLIADYLGDAKDVLDAYQRLQQLEPNLARYTLSLVPGERSVPGVVSLASNQLFSEVFSSPQKRVEDNYADAILKYKDFVEVEYTANYIDNSAMVEVVQHDAGFFLVHYSVEPKKLSVDRFEDKYSVNFELNGRVTDPQGKTVFQYSKQIPMSFGREELQDMEGKTFAIQDVFPLIPGHYTFDLLLKNTVSKEFTSFASDLTVPQNQSMPLMSHLILGYRTEKNVQESGDIVPFKIGDTQIICQSQKTFTQKDPLFVFFQMHGLSEKLRSGGELRFTIYKEDQDFFSQTKKITAYPSDRNFLEKFTLEEFPPGYYSIRVSVLDGEGKELLYESENFEITFVAEIPRPMIVSRITPFSRIDEYDYSLGVQYFNIGDLKNAKMLLEKTYLKNPGQLNYALGYAQVLFMDQNYRKVKEILEPFLDGPNENEGMLYLLGKTLHSLGEFQQALSLYQKYLSRFGMKLEILNLMGTCHYQLGDKKEALKVWERSLEVNPNQPDIKKLVESLKIDE
jgi:GWxTD domain-containing protein